MMLRMLEDIRRMSIEDFKYYINSNWPQIYELLENNSLFLARGVKLFDDSEYIDPLICIPKSGKIHDLDVPSTRVEIYVPDHGDSHWLVVNIDSRTGIDGDEFVLKDNELLELLRRCIG